jgi:hypothetical protein
VRRLVLATSTVCVLCGHDGSGDVHHLVPPDQGGDPLDLANLAPAHGVFSRCPWCNQACNQVQGDRPAPPPSSTSRRW